MSKLVNGNTIGIHIDCIGHTRTEYETSLYVQALKEKFGSKLVIDTTSNWYTEYKLKKE